MAITSHLQMIKIVIIQLAVIVLIDSYLLMFVRIVKVLSFYVKTLDKRLAMCYNSHSKGCLYIHYCPVVHHSSVVHMNNEDYLSACKVINSKNTLHVFTSLFD